MIGTYGTALRPYVHKRLEQMREADILVGIPCFNNEGTVAHVIRTVSEGLFEHFPQARSALVVADGGSTDDTRDVAMTLETRPWQEKLVTIYRGVAGKGTALRAIFEAADRLHVKACACVDSDLRSISTDWVKHLLDPVLEGDYEFVAPVYARYKYDGTITNNIVYNLTRSLYGKRIRQPIGGDFAFSRGLARHYLEQDVWGTDIARFGIDVWMTTNAVVSGAKICQANLGVKVHDAKDPAEALGPMFRQVCGTLFQLMEDNEALWSPIRGSEAVPTFGPEVVQEPQPIAVNQPRMVREFQEGYRHFGPVWHAMFSGEVSQVLESLRGAAAEEFAIPVEVWVKLLYELAAKYHRMPDHRMKMLSVMTPLYLGRIASFISQTRDMTSFDAEAVAEEQAAVFEEQKSYLINVWARGEAPADLAEALSEKA
ncbi:MAG: glycosyltransferase [Deltaproteobacteria bacterium]|nr:glycosyltransferase [Deltaproteobacteria bacterium]